MLATLSMVGAGARRKRVPMSPCFRLPGCTGNWIHSYRTSVGRPVHCYCDLISEYKVAFFIRLLDSDRSLFILRLHAVPGDVRLRYDGSGDHQSSSLQTEGCQAVEQGRPAPRNAENPPSDQDLIEWTRSPGRELANLRGMRAAVGQTTEWFMTRGGSRPIRHNSRRTMGTLD
jgi:hypothetical protein